MFLIAQFMRALLLLSLALPVVGNRMRTDISSSGSAFSRPPELQAIMTDANRSFQSGDYEAAERLYSRGLSLSRSRGDAFNAACFLAGIGNYLVLTNQYREAADAFRHAAEAAVAANHADLALRVAVNRATLYRRMGEKRAAVEAMREVRHLVPEAPPSWLLIQAGNLATDEIGIDKSAAYFLAAADRALMDGDPSTQASALAQLGYLRLQAGQLEEADDALTEAFRLRKLYGNRQTGTLYSYLSSLRLAQGDTVSALHLVDRALEMRSSAVPPPFLRYQRARVLAGAGRLRESLEEYEAAIELARDWRLNVLPADHFRIGADVSLQEMYSGYIEAEMASFRSTGQIEFARQAFQLAENNRAASLRESAREGDLSPRYWAAVAGLRKAIAEETAGDAGAGRRAEALRRVLVDENLQGDCPSCENSHQIKERTFSENSLFVLRQKLAADEALLSFHTSERKSYVWAMTRETFESHVLPGRPEIADAALAFRNSFTKTPATLAQTGKVLRDKLFGKLSSNVTNKKQWILSVDEPLHEVAFAALPAFDSSLRYLTESHSIRLVPGAATIGTAIARRASDRFIAFADGIYNGADPRWRSTVEASSALPRLAGTHTEAIASADAWGGTRSIFSGPYITRSNVQRSTAEAAAVVHFGAHVVPNRSVRGGLAIVLGLNERGTSEYLTPADIAGWRCPVGIVVLSACHSGTGEALPGAGLVGLTRAWLVAGAQAVTATHWPISDDAQPFFSAFYKHLKRHSQGEISAPLAAASLRAAQLEAIRGGGAHANPEYWAAFFIVGKQ